MMKEIIMITGASSGMGREFAMQIEKKRIKDTTNRVYI